MQRRVFQERRLDVLRHVIEIIEVTIITFFLKHDMALGNTSTADYQS